jgi:hypothetical protein
MNTSRKGPSCSGKTRHAATPRPEDAAAACVAGPHKTPPPFSRTHGENFDPAEGFSAESACITIKTIEDKIAAAAAMQLVSEL